MASGVDLPFQLVLLHEPQVNPFVPHIRRILHQNNFTLACHDPTLDLHKEDLIASSQLVIVCLSESYIRSSTYVQDLILIEQLGKRVIVMRFDSTLPEPRLKARTRRQVNFHRVTDPTCDEFAETVEKIMNCAHTLLSESPESPEVPLGESDGVHYPAPVLGRGGGAVIALPSDTTEPVKTLVSSHKALVNDAAVSDNTNNAYEAGTMSKPLKDLPGLVTLSRIMDTNPNRIAQLAACYDFSTTDLDYIRGSTHRGTESPAHSFFRFMESSNPDATVGELRRCLNLRLNTSRKALAAVNLYADEQLISDITWIDMKNLCTSGFEWRYVAECFGHGAHIEALEGPASPLFGDSRFDVLCDMICAQFPEHTVENFLENLRRLGFRDVLAIVVKNIEEYEGRKTEDELVDLR